VRLTAEERSRRGVRGWSGRTWSGNVARSAERHRCGRAAARGTTKAERVGHVVWKGALVRARFFRKLLGRWIRAARRRFGQRRGRHDGSQAEPDQEWWG
jgi:hypothetical protein